MPVVVLIGRKGAGKSTLAYSLAKTGMFELVSFRAAAHHAWPSESRRLANRKYVSDSEAIKVITPSLLPVGTNFVLDGFPRTVGQLEYIIKIYKDDAVFVHLPLSTNDGLQRLASREVCVCCGMPYNSLGLCFPGSCLFCGVITIARRTSDESERFLADQMADYSTKTVAMIEKCRASHMLMDLIVWVTEANEWLKLGAHLSTVISSAQHRD
jgi:adenylate kinase family enzyme